MNTELKIKVFSYVKKNLPELVRLIYDVTSIPSPTGSEGKKAAWIMETLKSFGAEGMYIDEVGNVIYPYHIEGKTKFPMYGAHIDTVFAGLDNIQPEIDGVIMQGASCGDNSSNVAAMLFAIKMFLQLNIVTKEGMVFAFNVGEEGLGNLKGAKFLIKEWGSRISSYLATDCYNDDFVNLAVGSTRYKVTVHAEGGHSWFAFGNTNAIHTASDIIHEFYHMTVPETPRTTYNIGTIAGGTTVNSIAETAEFTVDMRSENQMELDKLEEQFKNILAKFRSEKLAVDAEMIGQRPCSNGLIQDEIYDRIVNIRKAHDLPTVFQGASTDANVPLSVGIPALSFGLGKGTGMHKVNETLDLSTIEFGMNQFLEYMLYND